MEHVIIEHPAHYSAMVINYGPWSVQMRMKKLGMKKKEVLAKSGIQVELKHTNLMVGDYAALGVTWHPTREKYTERSTPVKHTIHIEVCT